MTANTFGRISNIKDIYNIFPDGDSNSIPQNSSQADKYLTNMVVTDPTRSQYFHPEINTCSVLFPVKKTRYVNLSKLHISIIFGFSLHKCYLIF